MILCEAAFLKVAHKGEGIEMVDVAGSLKMGRFVFFGNRLARFFAIEDRSKGFAGGFLGCVREDFFGKGFASGELLGFIAYGRFCG